MIVLSSVVIGDIWPPAAMATCCLPLTAYVIGVERALVGSSPRHNNFPVRTSNAFRYASNDAPMNTKSPPVTIGPPRLGDPIAAALEDGTPGNSPSGTCHAIFPVALSTAVSVPHGGDEHGNPLGEVS